MIENETQSHNENTLKSIIEYYKQRFDPEFEINEFTCYSCPSWRKCALSFDIYNTDGDCLMEK